VGWLVDVCEDAMTIADTCPGCEVRVEGDRYVVEDLMMFHKRKCQAYRKWWEAQNRALLSGMKS